MIENHKESARDKRDNVSFQGQKTINNTLRFLLSGPIRLDCKGQVESHIIQHGWMFQTGMSTGHHKERDVYLSAGYVSVQNKQQQKRQYRPVRIAVILSKAEINAPPSISWET